MTGPPGPQTDRETWVQACRTDDIEPEDVVGFDHEGRTFAIYRSPQDTFHATDGLCTHEHASLADGLVMGDTIECPKHNGRFDYRSGEVKRRPACVALRTYPRQGPGRSRVHRHPRLTGRRTPTGRRGWAREGRADGVARGGCLLRVRTALWTRRGALACG